MTAPEHLDVAYYHCISRVCGRQFLLGEEEKEEFIRFMRMYERFCGVQVVMFCVMSNHFHLLVGVPKRPEVMPDDEALVGLVTESLGEAEGANLANWLGHWRKLGQDAAAEDLREGYFKRMWSISAFMKALKQRFTQWFNTRHRRTGTLWEARLHSVLVEGTGETLSTIAAYIDLNPVRAGLVGDPKDYHWSGYGEAVAGIKPALKGMEVIGRAMRPDGPERPLGEVMAEYRVALFGKAVEPERPDERKPGRRKKGISKEKVAEVVERRGKMTRAEYLRCRVRYFTDGAAIGSRAFVESVFQKNRGHFPQGRKDGARRLAGLPRGDGLHSLRKLREPVGAGGK